jgi:hypothetical protein
VAFSRDVGLLTDPSTIWRKSSYCASGTCVEVAFLSEQVAVRDAKRQGGPVLFFSHGEWAAFVQGARNGELDPLADRRSADSTS